MRRYLAFVCVLAACGDGETDPEPDSEIGSYVLVDVNGAPLPWRSVATASDTQWVHAMRLELLTDSMYGLETDLVVSDGGVRQERLAFGFGWYGRDGAVIWFDQYSDPGPGGPRLYGTYAEDALTIDVDSVTLSFEREHP